MWNPLCNTSGVFDEWHRQENLRTTDPAGFDDRVGIAATGLGWGADENWESQYKPSAVERIKWWDRRDDENSDEVSDVRNKSAKVSSFRGWFVA